MVDFKTIRLARTVVLVFTWINMGFNGNMLYVCLPDILTRANATAEDMSLAFSLGGIGGFVVPLFAVVADKFVAYDELMLGGFVLVGVFTVSMKGISTHVWQFGIYQFIEAFTWGCVNAVGQSAVLRMWGVKSDPAMQAIHMGYPIGALLAPMVAVPFVSDSDEDEENGNVTSAYHASLQCQSYQNQFLAPETCPLRPSAYKSPASQRQSLESEFNDMNSDEISTHDYADDSSIQIAFAICGSFTAIIALCHVALQFLKGATEDKGAMSVDVQKEQSKESFKTFMSFDYWAGGRKKFGITVVTLTTLFFICHIGSTVPVITYLVTYAVDSDLGFDEQGAAWLQTAVSLAATFARAASIVITKYVPVNIMLIIELHGQLLFGILMLVLGSNSATALWITACLYAVFREPTWPSGMTWPNNYVIMTGFLVSVVLICISIFSVPMNYLIGYLYTNTSPDSIFYLTIFFGALNCVVLYVMLAVTRNEEKRQSEAGDDALEEKDGDIKKEPAYYNDGFQSADLNVSSTYL